MGVSKKKIKEALYRYRGNQAAAARALNITRSAVNKRIKNNEDLSEVYQEAKEKTLDEVENVIIEQALNENDQYSDKIQQEAAKFILARKGKERGYSKRHEISGLEGGPVEREYVISHEYDDEDNGN